MKEFKTSKGSFLAVKMPHDAYDFEITGKEIIAKIPLMGGWREFIYFDLPIGEFEIIGLLSEITEEQAKEVVDRSQRHPDLEKYEDYTSDSTRYAYLLNTALESYHSLMQANEIFSENPHQKSHFNPEEFIQEEYERFMEAQENTGNYLILKKYDN